MHLHSLVLFSVFLPGVASRSTRIADSRDYGQQWTNTVWMAPAAWRRIAGFSHVGDSAAGPRSRLLEQYGRRAGRPEPRSTAPTLRAGPRRATVNLHGARDSREDQRLPRVGAAEAVQKRSEKPRLKLPVAAPAPPSLLLYDGLPSVTRRGWLGTVVGIGATLPLAPLRGASASQSVSTVYAVAKATFDRRSFRGAILPNGLRVLLASDPEATTAAAAMNVLVGYLSDPNALPGLAHFCEHMLFLGTKPFPKEDEFSQLVSSSGGSNNAFTGTEETRYFFDVQSSALPEALERFASFFTAPLFTESATAREVSAIESEHSKNLQEDFWRYEQLFKLRADRKHPYSKFGTGNRETLRDGEGATRDALLNFHSRYYQADRMSLTVVGPQKLDELQSFAERYFAAVPALSPPLPPANAAYDELPLPFQPALESPIATLMVPVKDVRTLKVAWCMPVRDFDMWIRTKPERVWSELLSNRAEGGLLPVLKRQDLANVLNANVEEYTRAFIILSVSIDLTPNGLEEWRSVCSMLFAYLRKLSDAGVPSYLAKEVQQMTATNFEYSEPAGAGAFAESSSGELPFFPPEQWLTGPVIVEPGSEEGTNNMLSWCKDPRNALITLISQSVVAEAKQTEPIYGTRYGTVPLTGEVQSWSKAESRTEFSPPLPNPFIPTDFTIKCGARLKPAKPKVAPTVLSARPGLAVHFLQDATFRRPRASVFFFFRSMLQETSPRASITSQLFQATLAEELENLLYQAALAGLGAGVSIDYNGLLLTASGYNQRLPELLEYVAQQIKKAQLQPGTFDRRREAFRQRLRNFEKRQPIALCSYHRDLTLESPAYSIEQLQAAVETARFADITALQQALLPECFVECFLVGNLDAAEAKAMTNKTMAALPRAGTISADKVPRRKLRVLRRGRTLRQYIAPNEAEANSAVEVYLQVGQDERDDWLLLAVLSRLLEQPFYEELRTRQQLGYIVSSSVVASAGVRSIVFSVQSTVQPPPELERRIGVFLRAYRSTLSALPEADVAKVCDALAAQLTDVDQRLDAQAARFWQEIAMRRYDYSRPWRKAEIIRGITREQLVAFFDRYIAPDAPESRWLATHVFSKAAAAKEGELVVDEVDEDSFYPPTPDKFADLEYNGGDGSYDYDDGQSAV